MTKFRRNSDSTIVSPKSHNRTTAIAEFVTSGVWSASITIDSKAVIWSLSLPRNLTKKVIHYVCGNKRATENRLAKAAAYFFGEAADSNGAA